ncbi:MAG TPA: AarF/ABC1/UbiB kinase family protein [Nitrososphaeraceae archaeon]|jgi:predicted unusual protein kinase regulating ubiquinone biosynthesis (AarF/ABC1/UbiB family)
MKRSQSTRRMIQNEENIEPNVNLERKVSRLRIFAIILRLLPVIINFRKDRRNWVKTEGKNIDEERYVRHARRALKTFIDLGPSYIKLGQWLSTRADILPQPYLEILSKLQDDVPPVDFSKVRPILEAELGDIDVKYEQFNTTALSGASLGQVHLAKYKGKQVIVKVTRPGIEDTVGKDIYILKRILPFASRFIDPNLKFSFDAMLAQFIETIYEEMDYRVEAQNLTTIKHNLRSDKLVIIPNVVPELSSKHVLTMEFIPGIKITDVESLNAIGIDREKLIIRVHHVFFKMLLRHSIFHADPHPGNISVGKNGELILYDFGMVGRLDSETRLKLIRLYLSLIEKDPSRAVNVLIELDTLELNVNRYIVEKALELSIRSIHGKQVDKMQVNALMELSNKTLTRFPFRLPKNLALYMRMGSILEGIYQHHKIRFYFVKVLANLFEEEGLLKEAYIEEVKDYMKRVSKGFETYSTMAPMVKSYLEQRQVPDRALSERNFEILGSAIFGSALFLGSAIILLNNPIVGYCGISASLVIYSISILRRFKR